MPEACLWAYYFTPMMKQLIFILICLPLLAQAQLTEANRAKLQTIEADIQELGLGIAMAQDDSIRIKSNYAFIPKFVEALKVPGSFNYTFDSLLNLKVIYPDDRTFRVITWQVGLTSGVYRYYGAIQMNSTQLKLYPLLDHTDTIRSPKDTILSPDWWYGALYYGVVQTKHKGTTYYTMLGFDGNDLWSHKKIVEPWTFEKGVPKLGAPIFKLTEDYQPKGTKLPITRFIMEYKFDARVSCNYSAEEDMIVFEHLVNQQENAEDIGFARIPDGTYDAFKWENGKWTLYENVYDMAPRRKNPPLPKPVLGTDAPEK